MGSGGKLESLGTLALKCAYHASCRW